MILIFSLSLVLTAPPALVAGDRCTVSKAFELVATPGGKGKRSKAKKGEVLSLLAIDGAWAEIDRSSERLYARVALLNRSCTRLVSENVAAPVEPQPELTAAAPVADTPPAAPPPEVDRPMPSPTKPAPSPQPIVVAPPGTDRANKTKIAVMAVKGSTDLPRELVDSLTALISETLDGMGPFKAITSDDIMQMLQMEQLKQSLGCDQVSCLAEIGGAIGADFMITGSTISVGGTFLIQFQLMNITESKVQSRVSREYVGGPKGLLDEVRTATKMLVREILATKSGTLALGVSEEGATIKLDGAIVGTTPMPPIEIGGGVHTLSIEKLGFIVFSKDIDIAAKATTTIDAVLLPSAEYKRQFVEHATTVRAIAYVGMAVGVAGLAGGTALFIAGGAKAKSVEADLNVYNAPDHLRTAEEESALTRRRREVGTLDALTLATAAVGLAALAVGVGLFFGGDDPGHFEDLEARAEVAAAPQLRFGVSPMGLALSGSF